MKKRAKMKITDIGCPDFDQAARNRQMVKDKKNTIAYQVVENFLAHAPRKFKLPDWIPQDELPFVGRKDWQQYGGDKGGLYEAET